MTAKTKTSAARQFILHQLGVECGVFVEKLDREWNGCTVFSYHTETGQSDLPKQVAVDDNLCARFLTDDESEVYWKTYHNPYAAVREEVTETIEDGVKHVETVGYDIKGRKVLIIHEVFNPDGSHGIMASGVEADGYWHGGVNEVDAEGRCIAECVSMPRLFDENEVDEE